MPTRRGICAIAALFVLALTVHQTPAAAGWTGWDYYAEVDGVVFYIRYYNRKGGGSEVQWRAENRASTLVEASAGDRLYKCTDGAIVTRGSSYIGKIPPGERRTAQPDYGVCRENGQVDRVNMTFKVETKGVDTTAEKETSVPEKTAWERVMEDLRKLQRIDLPDDGAASDQGPVAVPTQPNAYRCSDGRIVTVDLSTDGSRVDAIAKACGGIDAKAVEAEATLLTSAEVKLDADRKKREAAQRQAAEAEAKRRADTAAAASTTAATTPSASATTGDCSGNNCYQLLHLTCPRRENIVEYLYIVRSSHSNLRDVLAQLEQFDKLRNFNADCGFPLRDAPTRGTATNSWSDIPTPASFRVVKERWDRAVMACAALRPTQVCKPGDARYPIMLP